MAVVRYTIEELLALNHPDRVTPAEEQWARTAARAVVTALPREGAPSTAPAPRRAASTPAAATATAAGARRRRREGAGAAAGQPQASERIEAALRESPLGRALAEYRAQPDDPQLRALRDTVNAHLESLRRRGSAAAAAAGSAPRKPPKKPLLEDERAQPLDVARDELPAAPGRGTRT